MKLKIKSKIGGNEILVEAIECKSIFSRFRGLMFRKKENSVALLFDFQKPVKIAIHSFFVFFPFFAVWLDDKNRIIEKKFVRPFKFCIKPRKKYFKLLEVPINKKYQKKILSIVDKRKV